LLRSVKWRVVKVTVFFPLPLPLTHHYVPRSPGIVAAILGGRDENLIHHSFVYFAVLYVDYATWAMLPFFRARFILWAHVRWTRTRRGRAWASEWWER